MEARTELLQLARRRRFARGEVVFHEGDPGDTLHLLAKGHAAVRVTTPLGDVATLLVLKPGNVFGELAVISPGPRNSTIVALDTMETLALHQEVFDELRERHPTIDRILVHALVAEVRRLSALVLDLAYLPVEKRVWRRLQELGRIFENSSSAATVIPLTQEELAQVVATTRPSINRLLREAEDKGILHVARGRLEIRDLDALARLAR
jgi:CRP-like cAMP-binding protein